MTVHFNTVTNLYEMRRKIFAYYPFIKIFFFDKGEILSDEALHHKHILPGLEISQNRFIDLDQPIYEVYNQFLHLFGVRTEIKEQINGEWKLCPLQWNLEMLTLKYKNSKFFTDKWHGSSNTLRHIA